MYSVFTRRFRKLPTQLQYSSRFVRNSHPPFTSVIHILFKQRFLKICVRASRPSKSSDLDMSVELHGFYWRSNVCSKQTNGLNTIRCSGHLNHCLGTSPICKWPWSFMKRHLSLTTTDYVYLLSLRIN